MNKTFEALVTVLTAVSVVVILIDITAYKGVHMDSYRPYGNLVTKDAKNIFLNFL